MWIGVIASTLYREPKYVFSGDYYVHIDRVRITPPAMEEEILDEIQRFGTVAGYKDWYKAGKYYISDNRRSILTEHKINVWKLWPWPRRILSYNPVWNHFPRVRRRSELGEVLLSVRGYNNNVRCMGIERTNRMLGV